MQRVMGALTPKLAGTKTDGRTGHRLGPSKLGRPEAAPGASVCPAAEEILRWSSNRMKAFRRWLAKLVSTAFNMAMVDDDGRSSSHVSTASRDGQSHGRDTGTSLVHRLGKSPLEDPL